MKLILEILDNGSVVSSKEYKSLREIHREYPQMEYHQLREIYLYCTGQIQRKMHPFNKQLLSQINIRNVKPKQVFNLFGCEKQLEGVPSCN